MSENNQQETNSLGEFVSFGDQDDEGSASNRAAQVSPESPRTPERQERQGDVSASGETADNVSAPDETADDQTAFESEEAFEHAKRVSRATRGWSSLSYRARMTLSFALIAAMTAIVSILVVSIVWEQHFQQYTADNMQEVAETTADQIAERYATQGAFTQEVLQPVRYALNSNKGIGIQVVDTTGAIMFDSTTEADEDGPRGPSLAPQSRPGNMARAAIVANDAAVGSVRVWVYGSNRLLRASDEEFRNQSYEAMIAASLVAIVLASLIGYLFARGLVRPIRRISKTAIAVKEGDLSARTGMQGDDEVSQLGSTFDAMAAAIERDRQLERRLTTDVAHELRTPLMAIQATVEAMVDGVFPMDEEHLETVNSEVQRLSRLVDSQLKLSRLENRANSNKEEVVDVSKVVGETVAMHDAYVQEHKLELEYDSEPDVYILGDSDLIRQATANLLSNAVRYTPAGGRITVYVSKDDSMAHIAVRDTGIGLTEEEANMVFSRFWRAGSARDRVSGGLGIGLTVVKEIADRHNGWVHVEGKPGQGACFTIGIPLYDEREHRRRVQERRRAQEREQREQQRAEQRAARNTGRFRPIK